MIALLFFLTSIDAQEVSEKVQSHVVVRFNGDYQAAFKFYAGADNQISRSELRLLLTNADIGNPVTRPIIAREVFARLDRDGSDSLTWDEVEAIRKREWFADVNRK